MVAINFGPHRSNYTPDFLILLRAAVPPTLVVSQAATTAGLADPDFIDRTQCVHVLILGLLFTLLTPAAGAQITAGSVVGVADGGHDQGSG